MPSDQDAGGAAIVVDDLGWRPARRRAPVLENLDLEIPAGQRVVVTGPSGAGKSTLLRAMAGLLLTADHGAVDGRVLVDGRAPQAEPGRVGLVLQDPRSAVVAETIGRDVAFGLENQCIPRADIWPRVRAALDHTGLDYPLDHPTVALSGGESQRLAVAGSLALGSQVLLLDEPTSMLDETAATVVRESVSDVVRARRTTLVVVEQHIAPWLDLVDRMVVLGHSGRIVADGRPDEVLAARGPELATGGVWVPGLPPPEPTVFDLGLLGPIERGPVVGEDALVAARAVGVTLRARRVVGGAATQALSDVDAALTCGRTLAVSGDSGAGKSTLLSVLAGLRRPTAGTVLAAVALATGRGREPWRWRSRELAARLAWVPQFPEQGVVARTVRDEVLATPRAVGHDEGAAGERADALLDALGLTALADVSPYHLSGGEQRRLGLAAALAHGARGLLLDEPTVGQDRMTWQAVTGAVRSAAGSGIATAIATHDRVAVAAVADDETVLERGRLSP